MSSCDLLAANPSKKKRFFNGKIEWNPACSSFSPPIFSEKKSFNNSKNNIDIHIRLVRKKQIGIGPKTRHCLPESMAEGVGVRHGKPAVEHQLRRVAGSLPLHGHIYSHPTKNSNCINIIAIPVFLFMIQPPRSIDTWPRLNKKRKERGAHKSDDRKRLTELRLLNDDGHLELKKKDHRSESWSFLQWQEQQRNRVQENGNGRLWSGSARGGKSPAVFIAADRESGPGCQWLIVAAVDE